MSADAPKARKRAAKEEETEKLLAKKLFGNSAALPDEGESSSSEEEPEADEVVIEVDEDEDTASPSLKPVWKDEDDEDLVVEVPFGKRKTHLRRTADVEDQKISAKEYEKRLRDAFNRTQGAGRSKLNWAAVDTAETSEKADKSDESDYDEVEETLKDMVASTGQYVARSEFLPKSVLNLRRLNDITRGHRLGKRPLTAVQFHPSKPVLMTAGENGVVSLFEVGVPPTEEAFLQDTQFKNFPITTAMFSGDGVRVIAGSRKQEYLFSYDMLTSKVTQLRAPAEMTKMNSGLFTLSPDGKYIAIVTRNEINVLSVTSMELISVLTTSSLIQSLQFSPSSSNTLFAFTDSSEVYFWDIRTPGERTSFRDDGGVQGSALRISNNSQFLACGSSTGIVNLYEMKDVYGSSGPKPVKIFDQLTTCVDNLAFSKDSQILSISSSIKANAARLIHTRSRTVFANYPPRAANVGKPTVSDFSPSGGYMAVGDKNGFLSLFRLHHFEKY